MNQITKRLVSMVLALGLGGGALFVYFNYTGPSYEGIQKMKSETAGKLEFVESQRETIKKVIGLVDTYSAQQELQQRASLAFPLTPDIAGALLQLNGLAQNNRIGITDFSAGKASIEKAESTGRGKKKLTGLEVLVKAVGTITFHVEFKSNYAALKEFVRGLETNMRIFNVQQFTLEPGGKANEDIYKVKMEVVAYYQAS